MATYDITASGFQVPSLMNTGDVFTCEYTGQAQSLTLPQGIYKLECWGAGGGRCIGEYTYNGVYGGYSVGYLNLYEPTVVYCYAGGFPGTMRKGTTSMSGGFNGGGDGLNTYINSVRMLQSAGGGASDFRLREDSLYARVLVAGGGGGISVQIPDKGLASGWNGNWGGGTEGGWGTSKAAYGTPTATKIVAGQTATEGTTFGLGANAVTPTDSTNCYGGGAGGGWYGGACTYGTAEADLAGGGGGSGYFYNENTASYYPTNTDDEGNTLSCLLNPQTDYLSAASTTSNVRGGNGYCQITVVSSFVTFKSRYQLRGDSYENWVSANPVLLKNELVAVGITNETDTTALTGVTIGTTPCTLCKIGDGQSKFTDLPWLFNSASGTTTNSSTDTTTDDSSTV